MIDLMALLVYFNAIVDKMLSITDTGAIMYLVNSYSATIRWLFTNMQQNLTNSVNSNISGAQDEFTNTDWQPVTIEKSITVGGFTNVITIDPGYFYMNQLQYSMPNGLSIYMEVKSTAPTTPPSSGGLLVDSTTLVNGGAYSLTTASGLSAHYIGDTVAIGQGFKIPANSKLYISFYDSGGTLTSHRPSALISGKWRSL